MKKLLFLLLTTKVFAVDPVALTLAWNDNINNNTNNVVNVYSSAYANTPLTNYTFLKSVVATNKSTILIVIPGEAYYYITCSNTFYKMQSKPSNVVSTPPFPVEYTLTITK